jgi:hypothetical protein
VKRNPEDLRGNPATTWDQFSLIPGIEHTACRGDQQAKDQGRQSPYHSYRQRHHVLGLIIQVTFGQSSADQHTEHGAGEHHDQDSPDLSRQR